MPSFRLGSRSGLPAAAAALVLLLAPHRDASAQEEDSLASGVDLQFHGFVSQGFIYTTDNDYLAHSERGSFELTEVGFNASAELTDRLRVGMQLFARDLGPIGDYRATMDWFNLDYRWKDWLGLRAGRVKIPFGLFNDISDIDAARHPVLLPQSIYPLQNRDFLLAQTGVELYGYIDLACRGALSYRVYGGTIFPDVEIPPQVLELTIPYVAGARLMWETPLPGLRIGGSALAGRVEYDVLLDPALPVLDVDNPQILWVASTDYMRGDLYLAAEYSRWYGKVESSDPMLFPEGEITSERTYAMASYRFAPLIHPGAYYSLLFPDTRDRSGRESVQHDAALTARFDLNLHWLLKLEAHYMNGTAGVSPELNGGRPREELTRNWFVFLAKTSAYF